MIRSAVLLPPLDHLRIARDELPGDCGGRGDLDPRVRPKATSAPEEAGVPALIATIPSITL
ncbi:hypothetical protein [Actinomadura miaoliensis]|uniref:Uncharacterized protein n=1 Tax=Actinomadura miaoliensis TaxID=430685 RepID=A0ABP7VLA8_9ACTN